MSLYLEQKRFFEEAYRTGVHGWPIEDPSRFVVEFLRSFQKKHPRGRILDIGCGEGRHTLLFAGAGHTAIGVDLQPLAIRRAKGLAKSKGMTRNFKFVLGDVFSLPFQPNDFDVLIDYGCLHHVMKKDFSKYLKSTLPLLRPGGYFLLSCFSNKFKHHPGERRSRDWMVHRGHYDRFFWKSDFQALFGKFYDILKTREEWDREHPYYVFHHVLMRKK